MKKFLIIIFALFLGACAISFLGGFANTIKAKNKAQKVAARVALEACYVIEKDYYNKNGRYVDIKRPFSMRGYEFKTVYVNNNSYLIKAAPIPYNNSDYNKHDDRPTLFLNDSGTIEDKDNNVIKIINNGNLSTVYKKIKDEIIDKFNN